MTYMLKWAIRTEGDPIAGLVRFISRGPVSHVDFLNDDETLAIGARAVGGVKARPVNYANFTKDIRFRVPCTQGQYDAAWAFINAQLGKPYDYTAIGGVLFDRDWHSTLKWFCSELWAATLENAALIGKIDCSIAFFTPEDALVLSSAMWPQV